MKKVIITLCCIILLSAVAFAEDEGRYVVKNVKEPVSNKQGNTYITEMSDVLIKIDTATGRVWQWADTRSAEGMRTEWVEMKDSNTQANKK
jgi:hypothetical protein